VRRKARVEPDRSKSAGYRLAEVFSAVNAPEVPEERGRRQPGQLARKLDERVVNRSSG